MIMDIWLLPRLELTPEQLRVVEMSPHEHRVILGPPGSGKTQVLIHRAAHLAESNGIPPNRYKIFVFTNVVKDYIKSGVQFLDLPEDVVSTFDHWCRLMYEDHISRKLPWRKNKKGIDWENLRSSVLELLKHKKGLQKSLDFVLVDEGQDLTPIVYEILSLVSNHITVFADPQQQIFKEGASESFILQALNLNKRNATLLGAYRNAPYVAQLASYFIADTELRRQYLTQICTEQKIRERPLCFVAPSFNQEMDRLADIIRQRQVMNERVGIIVPMNKHVFGMAKGLEERGVIVEKAIRKDSTRNNEDTCDFGNSVPKIATYHMAKGLTFDSVLLPRLVEYSFPRIKDVARQRIIFVGIARSTQWAYLSMVKDKEISEIDILYEAESEGHLTIQYEYDFGSVGETVPQDEEIEDDFSVL